MINETGVTNRCTMFGKGNHHDNGLGQLLAAGLVISFIVLSYQQHEWKALRSFMRKLEVMSLLCYLKFSLKFK